MDTILKLNGVDSHIFMCGGNAFSCDGSDVIVVVTGSPGIVDFYYEFATLLHDKTKLPICVVGHAGHDMVADNCNDNIISSNNISKHNDHEHLYNLAGQIEHKVDLFNNHIDKQSKLHIIGHSIGAWIVLEMVHRNTPLLDRVASIHLLFPVIQHIAKTDNCIEKEKITYRLKLLFLRLLYMLLPNVLIKIIIRLYIKHRYSECPLFFVEGALKCLHPKNMNNFFLLLRDEIQNVCDLNTQIIGSVKENMNVVYGSQDGWAPLHFMEDLKIFEPSLQMSEVKCSHAFTMNSKECSIVASIVSDYIKSKKSFT